MSILQLNDKALYANGSTFTLPRRSLAISRETITAVVVSARRGSNEWVYSLDVDPGKKYPHWRIYTESQLTQRINEAARHTMPVAA